MAASGLPSPCPRRARLPSCSRGREGGEAGGNPEGPRWAWQHLKHDLQDPHDWDKRTEQAYEQGYEQ